MSENVPRLPQELIDAIIDSVGSANRRQDLLRCSLVGRQWVNRSQRHLFSSVTIPPRDTQTWCRKMPTSLVDDPHKFIEHLTLGEKRRVGEPQLLWTANTYGDSLRPLWNVKNLTLIRWDVVDVMPSRDQAAYFPFREGLKELTLECVPNVNLERFWELLQVFPRLGRVKIKYGWCCPLEEPSPPVEERTPCGVKELYIVSCNAPFLDIFSQSAYPFRLRNIYLEDCPFDSIDELQRVIAASAPTLEVLEIRHCIYLHAEQSSTTVQPTPCPNLRRIVFEAPDCPCYTLVLLNILATVTGQTSQFSISVKFIQGYASHHDSQGDAPSVWKLLDKQLVRVGEGLELGSIRGFRAIFDTVAAQASFLATALPTAHRMGILIFRS